MFPQGFQNHLEKELELIRLPLRPVHIYILGGWGVRSILDLPLTAAAAT